MHKVKFTRSGKECDAEDGQTILEVGLGNGIEMQYGCCSDKCNKCAYTIRSGAANILHKGRTEGKEFRSLPWVRTCQAEVHGDVEVDA